MKYIIVFLIVGCTFLSVLGQYTVLASEGINAQIPFQGVLTDRQKKPLDGTFDIVFALYDSKEGGNLLWKGSYTKNNANPVVIEDGFFRVMLGSGNGNQFSLNFNDDSYFLGITIDKDTEMKPREQLGASAYAMNASLLDGLDSSVFLQAGKPLEIAGGSESALFTVHQMGGGDVLTLLRNTEEVFKIVNNGNVGIGTSLPEAKLTVEGSTRAHSFFSTTEELNTFTGALEVLSPDISSFQGNIHVSDGSGLTFGTDDDGLFLYQDTSSIGTNELMIGMRGTAVANNYVNISAPTSLSFSANAGTNGEGNSQPTILLRNSGSVSMFNTSQGLPADRYLEIDFSGGVQIVDGNMIVHNGSAGIGTSDPQEALDVVGTIRSSSLLGGGVALTSDEQGNIIRDPSDIKLKENIRPITNALSTIQELIGVRYEWKDKRRFGDRTEVGFIAQDVEAVLPEVVRADGEYMSINKANIIAVVVEAIKELLVKTEDYFTRTERLERQVEALQEKLHITPNELHNRSSETEATTTENGDKKHEDTVLPPVDAETVSIISTSTSDSLPPESIIEPISE